jgi:hypothetical protein
MSLDQVSNITGALLEGPEDRIRFVTTDSVQKVRNLSWLCLGDVRPHFERLKGGRDSPNHVTTDDSASDDCTSDEEDCVVETKTSKNTDPRIEDVYKVSDRCRNKTDHELLSDQSFTSPDSTMNLNECPWALDVVSPIIAQHLVDCKRHSQTNDANHSTIDLDRKSRIVSYHSRDNGTVIIPDIGRKFRGSCNDRHCPSWKKRRMSQDSVQDEILNLSSQSKCRSSVTMHTRVSVIPIPARDEYSPRVRESLWCSFTEMSRNITRNSIEFASEGWDWRNVMEDEEMLVHDVSGELIHPIHVQNTLALIGANEDLFSNHEILIEEESVSSSPVVSPPNFD